MNFIIDVIKWSIEHPFYAFLILFTEYAIMFELYHSKRFRWLSYPIAIIFIPQDTIVNIFPVSIIGCELPQLHKKEWLVTARLKRWIKLIPRGKRQTFRHMIAKMLQPILNHYDPGHI